MNVSGTEDRTKWKGHEDETDFYNSVDTAISRLMADPDVGTAHGRPRLLGELGVGAHDVGGAMMFAFWGAIILLIVLAIRWMTMGDTIGRRETRSPTALDILQERFAKGEIDRNEYEERRKVLRG